ncbi:MAG TPA: dynamin family protein [Polyangia bacterium]|jgi:tetratricopeptide (TPR) repeat protein/GTP-binding protein EngB required for normal cell division
MGILDRIAGTLDELVGNEDGDSELRAREEIALARAFGERGERDEAEARLADLARRHPRLGPVYAAQGELAAARGDDGAAATAFGRAVDLNPGDAEAWLGLGETLARLERFEPARDALRRALTHALAPARRPRAQATLGRLYARAGQRGKAVRELRKAVDALPDDVEIASAFGRALLAAGEPEGTEWLARAARLPGGSPRLLVEAATATNDRVLGGRLLDEAAARAPDDAVVRTARARHSLATADLASALREAEAAAAIVPPWPDAWRCLGDVRAARDEFTAAIEAARHEATLGNAPPFSIWLARALGTEDPRIIEQTLPYGDARDAGHDEARALVAGTLDAAQVTTLARLAPNAAARRFVIRGHAPAPVPAGNIVGLLAWTEALAEREPALLPLVVPMARAVEAFDRPLLVAVMGEFNAGKSSLVNALCGAEIAPVGVTPTTATINVLRFGGGGGRVSYHDGTTRELGPASVGPFLRELGDAEAKTIRQVEILAPLESLRRVEIVDTPGLNSLRAEHEKVARDFLVEADALVWVFAAGQAAKATEREALRLAHTAGKKVLGVVNKMDRASAEELTQIIRHVETELGPLVEGVVPLAAQAALAARQRGDDAAAQASGVVAFETRLETAFFSRARELKRATALAALRRFLVEARALSPDGRGDDHATTDARRSLVAAEARLRSTLAAERVALRARLNEGFRTAATEVREFVKPRAWLFGEHRADPSDEAFLADLLDDASASATATTRAALIAAIIPADGPAPPWSMELVAAVDDAVERFRAYARGIIEGATAVFFRIDLPRIRLDLGAIHGALARWSPDPEEIVFRGIERAVQQISRRAAADFDGRDRAREIDELVREENIVRPLEALAVAVDELERGAS